MTMVEDFAWRISRVITYKAARACFCRSIRVRVRRK